MSNPIQRIASRRPPASIEKQVGRLVLLACGVLYVGAFAWVLHSCERWYVEPQVAVDSEVILHFTQMELQAGARPRPRSERAEADRPSEEADVAQKLIKKEASPLVKRESVQGAARVTQPAATVDYPQVEPDVMLSWIHQQIEQRKSYPAAAESLGLVGTFDLKITLAKDGVIQFAEVMPSDASWILRRSLEKMLSKMLGHSFPGSLKEARVFEIEFEYE